MVLGCLRLWHSVCRIKHKAKDNQFSQHSSRITQHKSLRCHQDAHVHATRRPEVCHRGQGTLSGWFAQMSLSKACSNEPQQGRFKGRRHELGRCLASQNPVNACLLISCPCWAERRITVSKSSFIWHLDCRQQLCHTRLRHAPTGCLDQLCWGQVCFCAWDHKSRPQALSPAERPPAWDQVSNCARALRSLQ